MAKMYFDIRDIFGVIRLGWSGKKIWVGLCGLIIATAGYAILTTLAHSSAGVTPGELWQRGGLHPSAQWGRMPFLGTVLWLLGCLFFLAVVLLTSCMISKITYQQLKGDDFYGSGDALNFLKSNWTGVLFGPVAVLALFVFFVVVGIIIGWLAKFLPVGFAIVFIPVFFAALVAVFISISFVTACLMAPAIVGTVGEDTLEVVIQSFSLVWSQPWRLVAYTVWMKISVLFGVTILGALMSWTLWLITWACGLFMKEKLANALSAASDHLPIALSQLKVDVMANLPAPGMPSGSEIWAGRILAVMLTLLLGVFLAYAHSACASGLSLIYVILRKRKDDENLLEWEERGEPDEALTPDEPAPEASSSEEGEASGGSESKEETGETE